MFHKCCDISFSEVYPTEANVSVNTFISILHSAETLLLLNR